MQLRVAYIAHTSPIAKPKKQTQKQRIHAIAIAELPIDRAKNKIKARVKFAAEWAALEKLEKQLGINHGDSKIQRNH
jgi:hypothetical protein